MPPIPSSLRVLPVAFGLACLSCLSGLALLATPERAGLHYAPSPVLNVLALAELSAGGASVGALSIAFALALHSPPATRRGALLRCWWGTAATATVAFLPALWLFA